MVTTDASIAIQFAEYLVASDYDKAYVILSEGLKEQWSLLELKENYEEMVEYFEEGDPKVNKNLDLNGGPVIDNVGVWIYVPIESEGESEAVYVAVDKVGKIAGLEFGRP